ncbi:MAG: hypothetical protein M3217_02280 [Actinomycetota bacterium]|nr:hypothetical protein [Actinomycetota bacterium]
MALPLLQPTAHADVLDDGFSIVDTTLPGARECSTGATQPTVVNATIRGTGSISCTTRQAELILTICIEASPNGAPNSYVEVGCAPPQRKPNAFSITGGSHQVACAPEPAYYRTRAVGQALGNDNEVNYFGTTFSARKLAGCPAL